MNCRHCASTNLIGPFEMDGIRDGKYHARGLWWIVCRNCHKTTAASDPSGPTS